MTLLESIGKAVTPGKIEHRLKEIILKTGSYNVPYKRYGMTFLLTFLANILIYIFLIFPNLSSYETTILAIVSVISFLIIEIGLIILVILLFWFYYEFIIFRRTREIENVLPDFLEEVSINLRAGMSFDKSLWNSVEPEFGVLEKEIEIVAKRVMAGDDTEEALQDFAGKYDSTLLQESMDMVIVGLKSGGNIAELIDKIVENVKEAYYLRQELIASVTSYIIFISLTALVISPTLFALSFNLMEIIRGLGEKLAVTGSSNLLPFSIGGESINPEDFILFSKISVVVIASMSSMIIADLREGSIKAGFKYVLMFIPVAYGVYVGMLNLFVGIFGLLI